MHGEKKKNLNIIYRTQGPLTLKKCILYFNTHTAPHKANVVSKSKAILQLYLFVIGSVFISPAITP